MVANQTQPDAKHANNPPERFNASANWLRLLALIAASLLVISLCWFKIANLDLGYHLAYGNHLLKTGAIVGFEPDPFLRVDTAVEFVNLNWGSQLVFALVERVGGVSGLFILRLVLVGLTLAAGALIVWRHSKSATTLAVAIMLVAVTAYERFSLRPELFSYVILAWMLWRLDGGLSRKRDVALLAVLQLLLVNLHSYFPLGVALVGAFFVGTLLSKKFPVRNGGAAVTAASAQRIGVALVLQVVVCMAHPWHVRAFLEPVYVLLYLWLKRAMGSVGDTTESSWAAISEFHSPFSFLGEPINAVTIYAYLFLLLLALAGLIVMVVRRQWSWALVTIGMALVSFQMRRNIAPFALTVGPLALIALRQIGGGWSTTRRRRCGTILAAMSLMLSIGLIWSVVSGRLYFFERRTTRQFGTGLHDQTFSTQAITWLRGHDGVRPELYVDYFASSNALIGLPSRFKLFVDTNTFAYKDETLRITQELEQGRSNHHTLFDQHNINVVLLRVGSNTQLLVRQLRRDRQTWALAYFDRAHVIFIRRRIKAHMDLLIKENPEPPDEAWAARQVDLVKGFAHERALQLALIANVPLALGADAAAVPLLKDALDLVPDHAEAWRYLGVAYGNLGNAAARSGNYDQTNRYWLRAIDAFEKALMQDPSDQDAATYLSNTRQMLRRLPRR